MKFIFIKLLFGYFCMLYLSYSIEILFLLKCIWFLRYLLRISTYRSSVLAEYDALFIRNVDQLSRKSDKNQQHLSPCRDSRMLVVYVLSRIFMISIFPHFIGFSISRDQCFVTMLLTPYE